MMPSPLPQVKSEQIRRALSVSSSSRPRVTKARCSFRKVAQGPSSEKPFQHILLCVASNVSTGSLSSFGTCSSQGSSRTASPLTKKNHKMANLRDSPTSVWDAVIGKHWPTLVAGMQPDAVRDMMYPHDLLTWDQYKGLCETDDRQHSAREILLCLRQAHPRNVSDFATLLGQLKGHEQLGKLLMQEVQSLDPAQLEQPPMETGKDDEWPRTKPFNILAPGSTDISPAPGVLEKCPLERTLSAPTAKTDREEPYEVTRTPAHGSGKNSPVINSNGTSLAPGNLGVQVSNHQYSQINRMRPMSGEKRRVSHNDDVFVDDRDLSPPPLPSRQQEFQPDISMETCLTCDTPPVGKADDLRNHRSSLFEGRSYSPRQTASDSEMLFDDSPHNDHREILRTQSIQLDRLQESLLETLETIKAIGSPAGAPPAEQQILPAVTVTGTDSSLSSSPAVSHGGKGQAVQTRPLPTPPDMKTQLEHLQRHRESESDVAVPVARDSMNLDWSNVRRTEKIPISHYDVIKTPVSAWAGGELTMGAPPTAPATHLISPPYAQASTLYPTPPGTANGSVLSDPTAMVVEVFQDSGNEDEEDQVAFEKSSSNFSPSGGSLFTRRSSAARTLESVSSAERVRSSLSLSSSTSPVQSPGRSSIFVSREFAHQPLVKNSTLEMWMVAWIKEYLRVEPEDLDVFRFVSPPSTDETDGTVKDGSDELVHLLLDDMTMRQFKQQRADIMSSLSLALQTAELKVVARQVNEHSVLISLWLPLAVRDLIIQRASSRYYALVSLGVVMVQAAGRKVFLTEDKKKKGMLKKLKSRLKSQGEDPNADMESLDVAIDKSAMELWNLMGAVEEPLYHSVMTGNCLLCETLLATGLDPNMPTKDEETALHLAAQLGHLDVLELLIKKGAEVNVLNSSGMTPLHWAANQGNAAVTTELLRYGAHHHVADQTHGCTALHVAARMGFPSVVDVLLVNGADHTAVDKDGYTPLHLAVMFAPQDNLDDEVSDDFADVVELLLAYEAKSTPRSHEWITPMHLAAAHGHNNLIQLLASHGADINPVDQRRWQTPLHYAVSCCQESTVRVLLGLQADITATDKDGVSPLDLKTTPQIRDELQRASRHHCLLEADGSAPPFSVSLCVVGEEGVGKTALLQGLRAYARRKQVTMSGSDMGVRRRIISSCEIELGEGATFTLRDIPSCVDKHMPYSCYLGNEGSVYVVIIDLTASFDEQLSVACRWLDHICVSCALNQYRPSVIVIGSHADQNRLQHDEMGLPISSVGNAVLARLVELYDDRVSLHGLLYALDCRKQSGLPLSALALALIDVKYDLVKTMGDYPRLCNKVAQRLPDLRAQLAAPVVSWSVFEQLLRRDPHLQSEETDLLSQAARYLHDRGHLIYFEGSSLVVLNPDWLCAEGLSHLMFDKERALNRPKMDTHGQVTREELLHLLQDIPTDGSGLLQLAERCGLCLPRLPDGSLYQLTRQLPDDGLDTHWSPDSTNKVYGGRRWQPSVGTFPSSIWALMQAKLLSEHHRADPPAWENSFKVVSCGGAIEALVQIVDKNAALHVTVRGAANTRPECASLLRHLSEIVDGLLCLTMPGVAIDLFALSPWALQMHHAQPEFIPFDDALAADESSGYIRIGESIEATADMLLYDDNHIRSLARSKRVELCRLLNEASGNGRDWCHVADELGLASLRAFGCFSDNPAELLLRHWQRQPDSTVQDLRLILTDMKRDECVELLGLATCV